MKIIDRDGLRLCDIQADLFELASKKTNMSLIMPPKWAMPMSI